MRRVKNQVVDSNGGSYTSNHVTFNLDNFYNSGTDYFDRAESNVTIPLNLLVEFKNITDNSALVANETANTFCASLKHGSYQVIDKINFKLNGNEA
jgi:hypothetical protein